MAEGGARRRHRRGREPRGRGPRRGARLAAALAGLAAIVGVATAVGPTAPGPVAAGVQAPVRQGDADGPTPARQVEADGPQLPVRPEADDALTRERAADILEGDEYQAPTPEGETAGDRLREWLADRLPSLDGTGPAFDGAAWIVTGLVALAAVGGIAWVLATSARRRRAPDEDDVDSTVEVAPLRSPSEWADEAARCAAAGDHRGAVRAHFRVLTSTLAERRLVADTPGRTAGELRHDVAERAPRSSEAFDASATLFEEVWFGDRPAGPPETDRAAALTQQVLRASPRRGRSGGEPSDGDGDRPEDHGPESGGADVVGAGIDAASPTPEGALGGWPGEGGAPDPDDRDGGAPPSPPRPPGDPA